MLKKQFLDTDVIASAFFEGERKDDCQRASRQGGVTDALVLIEAFNVIERITDRDRAIRAIKALLRSDLTVVPLSDSTVFDTLKQAKRKLKVADLFHYTCAKLEACSAIVSYDRDFNGLDIPRKAP